MQYIGIIRFDPFVAVRDNPSTESLRNRPVPVPHRERIYQFDTGIPDFIAEDPSPRVPVCAGGRAP
jgi:hypothetical protein